MSPFFKKITKRISLFFEFIKKFFALLFYKILNMLFHIDAIKNFFISKKFYLIIAFILKIFGNSSNSKIFVIHNKLKKILDSNRKFTHYNQKLLFHFQQSNKSREYLDLLNGNKK